VVLDRCLSCPVRLSVTLVYYDQTVGWVKIKLGTEVGLGRGHIVLDGDAQSPSKTGHNPSPIFCPCRCGQTAGWIKVPLGTEVSLGPCDIALDGDPASPTKGEHQPPTFRHMSIVAKRLPLPISATAELLFKYCFWCPIY